MSPTLELLRRNRQLVMDERGRRGVTEVRIFGSSIRDDDDHASDIDLLLELPGERSAGGELMAVLELSEDLSELLGVRVDVVTARSLRPEVRDAAMAEALPL